ncbi:LysR family transcriptional regulator [Yersinia mollaretii]|uniref:LysR family transcriptional regulator n=1 Tax=Yersinia mollaretii TaxID=33060 RepID=A0AA36PHM0_YERMO|nr:LysR family transcriptional regulator [Yersinia mollaretii]MDA5526832.1 LysR family transcriptional regulator [Yersinia mollaretii]MDA5534340.1 LysR family transcriptional regulator [Yersinia mollaretii]MDR7872226.1 LysR family transcriptional regulator [Yersinia mollaretii]NIL02270.1 LysR family transcriptional regulator [Yersinia mollaretii]PHZ31686.1 LysR family transcriptional regulator [Yersinia mollaretii]
MFLSRKLEAFMAVVENGSLSKAARVMNRTTPPVAKSIKDFEYIIGKKLFKREKFGMSLTRDGEVLYNDLKDLYQQEKEITKKHLTGHVSNVINIYYDWGKSESLIKLCKVAEKNNIQANVIQFFYENIDDIGDYDGNSLILSSEIIPSDKFMLLNEVVNSGFGIYGRKDIINESQDILSILHNNIWLCNPVLYRSKIIKNLEENVKKQYTKVSVRQVDNLICCLNFIYSGRYVCITDSVMDDFNGDSKLDFINLSSFNHESKLYFYKSRSHSSVLNRLIDYIQTLA